MGTLAFNPTDLKSPEGQASAIEQLISEFNDSQLAVGDLNTLPIAAFGRVNVNGTLFTNTNGVGTVAHNLGYTPMFKVYMDQYGDGSVYISLPYVLNTGVPPYPITVYHHARTDPQNLQLISTATLNYPTNPNARFTFFYFIFAVPMPT